MPTVHVCSLARLHDTVARTGARRILTVINAQTPVPRPAEVEEAHHLFLGFNDIAVEVDGMVAPSEAHVRQIVDHAHSWDQTTPYVIHCFAGISRSTASALITAIALDPSLDEHLLAREIRARSSTATPNIRMIGFADALLGRRGRLVAAVESIGRGVEAYEGVPFEMPLRLSAP